MWSKRAKDNLHAASANFVVKQIELLQNEDRISKLGVWGRLDGTHAHTNNNKKKQAEVRGWS